LRNPNAQLKLRHNILRGGTKVPLKHMNLRKHLLAFATSALVLGAAGAASATQYILAYTNEAQFGSGPFGTVDVTGTSTDLHFEINVAPGFIVDTGAHYAVTMNLSGTGFALVGAPGFTLEPGSSFSNAPFGGFNIALNCTTACGNGSNAPHPVSPFTFDITGTGLGVLAANNFLDSNQVSHPINFAVDVVRGDGITAVVGGGLGGAVPEPATWGLMILGFGGAGAALRSRRRKAAAFA